MSAAFFRCLAGVLSLATSSLIFILRLDSWAAYVTCTQAAFAYLATGVGNSAELAFLLSSGQFASIRDVRARPP